ncbi:MAG: nicotinate phosphoribosyltransferase [Chloroflexi bacterium]|nr:nicotinate phosphoribosyltransferase [Chloroflexota bacterium]
MADLFDPAQIVVEGHTADVYFLRTREILQKVGLNPVVTMEVFPARDGILCGMREVIALLRRVLPQGSQVWALEEGEMMREKEVVLRIRAPYLSFAIYETAYLGILAQESGWASAARAVVEAARPTPVISFGARHVHPEVAARLEYAALVGGCASCATPAGARLGGIDPSGTIPHAMVLIWGDTVKAATAFDRHMPPEVQRIVLVDTFRDEVEEALRVAQALGDRLWGVRLDTPSERGGVTPDLIKEVRARLDGAGYSKVKIVVSGGVHLEKIRRFKDEGAPVDAYGVGSAISSSSPIDFTADIKAIEGVPIAKRGRIPGEIANPRLKKTIG